MAALKKLTDESEYLYTQMLETAQASPEGTSKFFFQSDILALAPPDSPYTVEKLMHLTQDLINHSRLRSSRLERALCWTTRPRDTAKALTLLNKEEKLLYSHVEDAAQKGMWLRDLKKRTSLAPAVVQKAMLKMEASRLVKVIKNIKNPAQKTYMLFHLIPGDDLTGGSFFDGGDLDEGLVEELGNLIVFHVRQRSWAEVSRPRKVKREASPVTIEDDDPKSKKRKRGPGDIEDTPARKSYRSDLASDTITQLSWPAGSHPYPTAEAIHHFLTTSDAIKEDKSAQLTVSDIQGIIDVLVWDGRLEPVGAGGRGALADEAADAGYRTVRGVIYRPGRDGGEVEDGGEETEGNGLTQTPCGRCPVVELCGVGGPVNAASCVYWSRWLESGG